MPVISRVGRRHPAVVVTVGLFYLLLLIGGVAMVYPFLLMVATSVTSTADLEEYRLLPRYLYSRKALFAKYVAAKHESAAPASARIGLGFNDLKTEPVSAVADAADPDSRYDPAHPARMDDYVEFIKELPDYLKGGAFDHLQVMNLLHHRYRDWLAAHVGDVRAISQRYREDISDMTYVYVQRERPDARDWAPDWNRRYQDYRRFKMQTCRTEPWLFYTVNGDSKYIAFLKSELGPLPEMHRFQFLATDPVNRAAVDHLSIEPLAAWLKSHPKGMDLLTATQPEEPSGGPQERALAETAISWFRYVLQAASGGEAGKPTSLLDLRLPVCQPSQYLARSMRPDTVLRLAVGHRQWLIDRIYDVRQKLDPKPLGEKPKVLLERDLWERFVRTRCPLQMIGFDPARMPDVNRRFAAFLRDHLKVRLEDVDDPADGAQPAALPSAANGAHPPLAVQPLKSWDDVTVPDWERLHGRMRSHFERFIQLHPNNPADAAWAVPADWFVLDTVEQRWRAWLREKYGNAVPVRSVQSAPGKDTQIVPPSLPRREQGEGHPEEPGMTPVSAPGDGPSPRPSPLKGEGERKPDGPSAMDDERALARLNAAHGTRWPSIEAVRPPALAFEEGQVYSRAGWWRGQFLKSNYREVLNFILFHGNALANTFTLIVGTIFLALTVNPLAAYALSRFSLKYSHKVLIFLLATMAFPAEVTMIPGFLLVRDLGMLNTFFALLLPGAAAGFSIFLLKGFFDTLPKELYEAAQLDGAGELRMFYQITVPLCKPVFAFMALGSFTAAYGAFLFAMLTCQDPRMWTMMVWLYDLSNKVGGGLQVAAFTVAAIPTLLVFVFCQKIIMRGIILPQMH